MEKTKKEFKEEFCVDGGEFNWLMQDIGSPVDGEEIVDWWLKKLDLAVSKERTRIEDKLETMQLEGLSFSEAQKDAYNTAIRDVLRFIKPINTK